MKLSAWHGVVPLYLSWRLYWAARLPLMDCDEVYNYWEPLAFVLYGSDDVSSSLQTWEYAHEHALRTYAYLVPLARLAALLPRLVPTSVVLPLLTDFPVHTEKLATFVLLRAALACGVAAAELTWLYALSSTTPTACGHRTAYTGLLLLTAAGMNHAAGALLPSASWMGAWLLASACFLRHQHVRFCVVAIVATLALGWPFGVLLLLPLGLRILWKEYQEGGRLGRLLAWILFVTCVVQGAVMAVDHSYYGTWLSPTLNILTYNTAGGGDELYGVEATSYYVKNLLVNLNFVAPLGLVVLPLISFTQLRDWDLVTLLSPLYLWLAVVVPRPHKEERFLFPIYPLLCLGAVLTVDKVANAGGRIVAGLSRHKELMRSQRHLVHLAVWSVTVVLSLARLGALYHYYTAPLHIYAALAEHHTHPADASQPVVSSRVCTCGEWYRFPSSFFLPPGMELAFLESSFTGQLPQPFSIHGSRPASRDVLQPFNNLNQEEPSRYVPVDSCDWIVDLEGGDCAPPDAEIVQERPFLDAGRTQALHRVLYVPFLHERAVVHGQVHYQSYRLYKLSSTRGMGGYRQYGILP
jgi:alpha-1,2-mannosyltransferase